MIIKPTSINCAVVIEAEPICDMRGAFARSFCKKTLEDYGLKFEAVQCNMANNIHANTIRGMHFQKSPFCEQKIVSCLRGAIYDVIIDLNKGSTTFGKWFGIELNDKNAKSLYVPKGFAHGYQTLTPDTVISYMVSEYYSPSYESGIRWDDNTFGIRWREMGEEIVISEKDRNWKDFNKYSDGI